MVEGHYEEYIYCMIRKQNIIWFKREKNAGIESFRNKNGKPVSFS